MSHPSFPGNIPAGGAATFSGWARNGQKPTPDDLTPEAQAYREYSQIQATLALAYEQRTATLVQALLSDSLVTDGKYDEIQAEVRKRLGLGDNK